MTKKILSLVYFIPLLCLSQVGIGTETPDASSIFEVNSTESGVLLPRMTTVQRNNISDPADGLTVFDTDEDTYYYYQGDNARWVGVSNLDATRDNYVIVKTESDFPVPSAGTITLDENTYYEINGLISLTNTIDLNGAYLAGKDTGEDILTSTGTLISSTGGGFIKNLTLSGGTTFDLDGGNFFSIQNSIIANATNVGSIQNTNFVFSNNIQFINNSSGVTYTDIDELLLNNQAWLNSNSGTYETYSGTFELIQKISGFFDTSTGNTAIDVSNNPTVGTGVVLYTIFKGTATDYINEYSTGNGVNFNKNWYISAPGIQDEYDELATGNIYRDGVITSGDVTETDTSTGTKLALATLSSNLLRFDTDGTTDNRLRYIGSKTRFFTFNASLSVRIAETVPDYYTFYIVKNGTTVIDNSNTIFYNENSTVIKSLSLSGNVELDENDYIEIWVRRLTNNIGSGVDSSVVLFSMNLSLD